MAAIFKLFRAPKRHFPMVEAETVQAVTGFGFSGCAYARKNSQRQLLLVDKETLDAMDLAPGIIRENITTQGLNVNGLALGEQLRIGQVLLQVSAVCTPCDQLEKVRRGLRRELYGRRGMLCTVVAGGPLHAGATIQRMNHELSA